MAKASLSQYATGHSEGGTVVTATLTANITAHHQLIAIVGYYDPTGVMANNAPEIAVIDALGNKWVLAQANRCQGGGNLAYYVFACPDSLPSSSSTLVTATSLATGNLLIGVMEWAPGSGGNIAGPAFTAPGFSVYGGPIFTGPYEVSGDISANPQGPWIFGRDPLFDYLNSPVTNVGQVYLTFMLNRTSLLGPVLPVQGSSDGETPTHLFHVDNGASAGVGALDVWAQEQTNDYSQCRNVFIAYLQQMPIAAIGAQYAFSSGAAYAAEPVESPHAYYLQGNGVVKYSGVYYLPIMVSLTQTQQNVVLYWNTGDGTQANPTTGSTLYTTPISVASSQTIKVLAHDPTGYYADTVWSYKYTIQAQPQDGVNSLCLEIVDDTTTLPEPSINLSIQQLDHVLNGTFSYAVLDQTARQILDGYAVDVSQCIILILTGALTNNVILTFSDPSRPANNPTDASHPAGRNPLGYYTAMRPIVIINNTTGGHSITIESEPGVTPTYTMSGAGPKFLYNGGLLGIREIV